MPRTSSTAGDTANHNDDPIDETSLIRIESDLKAKITLIVKRWRATKPAFRKLTEAQYLAIHVREPMEHDYAEMVREQQAEVSKLRPGKPRK